jgi:ATPase subunit of ABC transporter with duplicated ATPase domains
MIRTHELEHSSMATVLEVRGLTRMIELPPKVRKPQPLINTPSLTAAAAPEEAPALQLDADPEAAAKLEEEKKKAAAEAVARESMPRMRMIFSNVSFSLNRGTTLALVGPPKCGKTQLLRVR